MTITVEDLVRREFHYCVSFLVSTLAGSYGNQIPREQEEMQSLVDQAFDLCSPIDDWEEAAFQAGFKASETGPYVVGPNGDYVSDDIGTLDPTTDDCWNLICEQFDIEPYQREVYEHWIVSDWLAGRLAEKGEKVDKDFAGLTVWARTCTGQGIASDSVIEAIHADLVGEA